MTSGVKIVECPRDAWQGLRGHIPATVKAEYLRALISAGFKHLDAVSFVSPKAVPQMADSEEVLKQLDPPDDVEIIGIVVNEKGAERAIATEAVRTLGFPYSLSPTFLRQNQNQSLAESLDVLEKIKDKADDHHLGVVVYISMAFGNPYCDAWDAEELAAGMANLEIMGVKAISLADTIGLADAAMIANVMKPVLEQFSHLEIGAHLHSRREHAAAKTLAAYDAGCRRFDSALGGLGGCPFAQDQLVGNIPTEVLLEALRGRGAELQIKKPLNDLMKMSQEIAENADSSDRNEGNAQ